MGAAARAGRDAYARACLVDASERRLDSRKSIVREEDQEVHLWAPHWKTVAQLSTSLVFLRRVGGFLIPVVVCWFGCGCVVRAGPNPFPETGFLESGEVYLHYHDQGE